MDVHIMHMMHILTECSTKKTYKRSSVNKERRSIPAGVMSDLCDSGVTPLAIGAVACPTLIPGVVHVVCPRPRLMEIRRKKRNESEISHSIVHVSLLVDVCAGLVACPPSVCIWAYTSDVVLY